MADKIKEAFCLFDRNGDGYIDSAREFPLAARSLGLDLKDSDLNSMSGDKLEMSIADFRTLMEPLLKSREQIVQELVAAFSNFDREKTGTISASELSAVLSNLGEALSAENSMKMMKEADPSESGRVNYASFAEILAGR